MVRPFNNAVVVQTMVGTAFEDHYHLQPLTVSLGSASEDGMVQVDFESGGSCLMR